MVYLIELEIMLRQRKILKKVLRSIQMSNLDLKKKIFTKRERNQLIYKKEIRISTIVNLQPILLMKLMRLTKKWERHVQTQCFKERQMKRKAIYRTFKLKKLLVEVVLVKYSLCKKLMMVRFTQ
jgi:hypothetical protein